MKKTSRRIFGFTLVLTVLVVILSLAASAAAVERIEGTVKASRCPLGDIMLMGDTVIVMDKDLTLRSISGNYNLTVQDQGGYLLKIKMPLDDNVITANPAGHGISVKSFTSNANLDITARKDGLNMDQAINITGGNVKINCGGDAIYSRNSSIAISGATLDVTAVHGCIVTKNGTGDITVSASGMAKTTGESAYCIIGKNITLTGYAPSLYAVGVTNAVVSYGDIELHGAVNASSTKSNSVAFNARSGGDIRVMPGAVVNGFGGAAFWALGDVYINENTSVNAYAGVHGGIGADGDVLLKGTVYVDAKGTAIKAGGKLIHYSGTVDAKTTEDGHYGVESGEEMRLSGTEFKIQSNDAALMGHTYIEINEDVTAASLSEDCYAVYIPYGEHDHYDVERQEMRSRMNQIVINSGTVRIIGAGGGIDCPRFIMYDGDLTVRGYTKRAIFAIYYIDIYDNSTINLRSEKENMYIDKGSIELSGNATFVCDGKDYYAIRVASRGGIAMVNGTVNITSAGGGIRTTGGISVFYPLVMTDPDYVDYTSTLTITATNRSAIRSDEGGFRSTGNVNLRSEYGSGIYTGGSVEIDGTLVAVSGANKDGIIVYYPNDVADMYGIYAKDVTVKGKAIISAAWNNAVYAAGNVTVSDTGSLDVLSAKGKRSGIVCKGDMTAYGYVRAESYEGIPAIWTDGELKIGYPFVVKYPYNAKIRSDKHTVVNSEGVMCNKVEIDKRGEKLNADVYLEIVTSNNDCKLLSFAEGWPEDVHANVAWQASSDNIHWITVRTDKDVTVSNGNPVLINSWYTIKDGDYGLYFRAVVDADEYSGKLATNSKYLVKKDPLTGNIVFTSGARVFGRLTTARTGLLNTLESADASKVHFKWQMSLDGEHGWTNIAGATKSYYDLTNEVGKYLRLTATVDGYTGTVCSPAKLIIKAKANNPISPSNLTYSNGVVSFTNAWTDQEYVLTYSYNPPSAYDWSNAVIPTENGTFEMPVNNSMTNCTVYVHTRTLETALREGSTTDKCAAVYTGTSVYLQGLKLNYTSLNTKVGSVTRLAVSPLPPEYTGSWDTDTVRWYVNKSAAKLYLDQDCTQPYPVDDYGVAQPVTNKAVYLKAIERATNVTVGVERTVGYNDVKVALCNAEIADANGKYVLNYLVFEDLNAFTGEESFASYITKPDSAYVGELSFVRKSSPEDAELSLSDGGEGKVRVNVPADAPLGDYLYEIYVDGAPTTASSILKISVSEKTATVTFDDGDNAQLSESASLMSSAMAPQTVPLGAQFILPENEFYVPDGYEFDGWDLGNAGDGIDVTEDVVVTAVWKKHYHNMVHEKGFANTCTTVGRMEHWYCEDCGIWFGDENGNYPIDNPAFLMIPAHGHDTTGVEPIVENSIPASCTDDGGYDEIIYCSVCGEEVSREHFDIPATGHLHTKTVRENEISATCTENGSYNEVVYCTDCGEKLSEEAVNVNAAGHEWKLAEWMWDNEYTEATAVFTCVNDKMHTQTADAQITVDDSGVVNGNVAVVYTAKVTFEGVQYSDEKYNVKTYNGTLSSLDGREISYSLVTDTGEFIVVGSDGYVNASHPVLVVSYDKNGRFIGVSFITQTFFAQRAVANNAASVKVMWWSMSNLHPDSDNTELLLFP